MASANQRKATFISNKLKLLKEQGDDLISAVGHYVNNIIAAGDSWTQGGDNNMGFQELCQKIDTAVEVLCEKCEELAGASVGAAANQLSCEQQNMASKSTVTASSTSATSDRQPAAPLASTATTSYRQSTESVQAAGGAPLKPVLDRIAVTEEAMCSFRSRTEKVAEQQSGIDHQLKELLSKLSESDKKQNSRFKQIKQQISDISETRDAIEQEQTTRLQSLEEQLQKISTAQNKQKKEMKSQAELVKKLVHVPNLLESVKENVDALDARIDGNIDDCRHKHEDIKTVTGDLADKVMVNTQSVQLISESQVHKTTLLRELETRLQTLEADGGRNVKDVQKQVEKGAANLSRLIQEVAVMSPRLQQLEVKSSRTRCGFSAEVQVTEEVADYTRIREYETTSCNVGNNFNADSGLFTAPVDGLYVASISMWLWENEHLGVSVQYKQSLDQMSSTTVCTSSAVTKDTTTCDVGIVDMKAGEVLYSCVDRIENNNYNKWISFSCFLLG